MARDDALLLDHHMGGILSVIEDGQKKDFGHRFSTVPGDGGAALLPLFMSPAKAKEHLMLAEPQRASELARMGIINYAVPAAELDRKVNEVVERLLNRGAYQLAWTKRGDFDMVITIPPPAYAPIGSSPTAHVSAVS